MPLTLVKSNPNAVTSDFSKSWKNEGTVRDLFMGKDMFFSPTNINGTARLQVFGKTPDKPNEIVSLTFSTALSAILRKALAKMERVTVLTAVLDIPVIENLKTGVSFGAVIPQGGGSIRVTPEIKSDVNSWQLLIASNNVE